MKQFKEFRSEQTHIKEIGPIGATIAGAIGLLGLGIGGYKLYKKTKEGIKGYREAKKEKEENSKRDVYVNIKKWDDDEGKVVTKPVLYAKAGSKEARISNDDLEKKRKELQKAEDPKNASKEGERDAADDAARQERGGIEDVKDAEEYYKNNGEAPAGWRNAGTKKKPELMTTADYKKEMERKKKVGKRGRGGKDTSKPDKPTESNMLKFGEFITEDVMKDLKKISKSKKDMEIKLSDGSEIPIDPMTAEIFVKYIEGLSSSEKKRTIQQIQRTERAFMKVLGKAHEG